MYSLNKYKFNKKKFLPILSNILNKIIGGRKKIIYNIINLKSIAYNTDILTNVLALKIKKKKMEKLQLSRYMVYLIDNAKLCSTRGDMFINRSLVKNYDLFLDKYKDLKIISIIDLFINNIYLKIKY